MTEPAHAGAPDRAPRGGEESDAPQEAVAALEEAFHRLVLHHRRSVTRQAEQVSPGLSPGAMQAFLMVCHHGSVTPSALAEQLLVDRAQVSRAMRELEGLGLVRRAADPRDRRSTLVTPTEEGRARLDEVRGGPAGTGLRAALADWDPADVRTLADLLGRFVAGRGDEPPVTRW